MQTGGLGVEALEARRNAGDALAAPRELGDLLEHRADDGLDALDAARLGRARDLVNGLLGAVDELLHLAYVAVAFGRHALAGRDELPHAPLLVDDPRVRVDVRDRRTASASCARYAAAAHLREALAIAERAATVTTSIGVPLVESSTGRFVDAAVGFGIEVLGLEDLEHLVERVALEQNCREHRRLGVEIVRRHPAAHGRRGGSFVSASTGLSILHRSYRLALAPRHDKQGPTSAR